MASILFRGLKAGVNLSCTSTAVSDCRRRSLDNLSSNLAAHRSPASSSSRCLLDEDDYLLDEDPFDALIPPGILEPSASTSSSSSEDDRLRKVRREDHVSHLRSSASFHAGDGGGCSWVRFHTVDGGESAALSRLPRPDPRPVQCPSGGGGGKGKMASCSSSSAGVKLGKKDGKKAAGGGGVLKSIATASKDQVPLQNLELKIPALENHHNEAQPTADGRKVVALRVSLHCKACEGKVRKHLSRMPGVTSYSIDFASKKVTVTGDVSPLEVLSNIAKVKNAQFWPSSPSPAAP